MWGGIFFKVAGISVACEVWGEYGFGTLFSNKKPNETFRQAYFPEENGDIREKLYYQIVEYFDWGSFKRLRI